MAATKQQSRSSANGAGASVGAAAKEVSGTAASAARRARSPLLAAGAAVAGVAVGSRLGGGRRYRRRPLLARRRRVLGMPIGRKSGALRTVELLRDGAKHLDSASRRVSRTTEDIHEIRAQLERVNRQSPLEVVLDGLTHRRGAHRREG